MKPYLVFCGTLTTIVRAQNEEGAWYHFLANREHVGDVRIKAGQGRLVPPTRDEVTIRRPTEADRGWIEDSRNPAFLALLPELVPT